MPPGGVDDRSLAAMTIDDYSIAAMAATSAAVLPWAARSLGKAAFWGFPRYRALLAILCYVAQKLPLGIINVTFHCWQLVSLSRVAIVLRRHHFSVSCCLR